MLVAIRKYCSDLLWRSHPPKNMGRARANVTRRTCFSGIFIVNLQGPGEARETGHPGEAPNSTPKRLHSAKRPVAARKRKGNNRNPRKNPRLTYGMKTILRP